MTNPLKNTFFWDYEEQMEHNEQVFEYMDKEKCHFWEDERGS
jgi:hypothetical protein